MKIKALLIGAIILAGMVAIACLLVKKKADREPIVKVEIDDPGMEYAPEGDYPQTGAMATMSNPKSIVTATKGWLA